MRFTKCLTLVYIVLLVMISGKVLAQSNETVGPTAPNASKGWIPANTSVYYDEGISNALENWGKAKVIVKLVDASGIVVAGTKEERRQLTSQIDEWFRSKINETISAVSEEFVLRGTHFDGFYGIVSKKGFARLLNDSHVRAIYLDETGGIQVYASDNDFGEVEGDPTNTSHSESITNKTIVSQNGTLPEGGGPPAKNVTDAPGQVEKQESFVSRILNFLKSLFGL